MNKAAFLDRDGVINHKAPEGQYVTSREVFEFLPGVAEAISKLNHAGYKVIVVSNQRCVAKGLIREQDLLRLHDWMRGELASAGAVIDDIVYCPHDKVPACACRKPEPGMLLAAAAAHRITLAASWMIGDSDSDVEAGRRAGCRTVRVTRPDGPKLNCEPDLIAPSLAAAVEQIISEPAMIPRRSSERPPVHVLLASAVPRVARG